ncbi:response regulator transcription factor [Microcella sp.]|uniref:response regulator transcription factor n=1 Tax=Microcella sp. TaxID=1913979 RepID=UPI0026121635|nr:response regulator transcription factor [Microcella sp.]
MVEPSRRPGSADRPLDGRRVLVVDDDPTLLEIAAAYLSAAGAAVDTAADSVTALQLATQQPPDLVVLDRMIPGVDGITVAHRLRRESSVPIIMLTALAEPEHRIEGLEAGVDDYVAKPFSPRELVLRAEALLRRARAGGEPESDVVLGRLRLDAARRELRLDGTALALTAREYDLLAYLARRPDRTISRDELLADVWGWTIGDVSTITVHVRRLREKLEADAGAPEIIQTVWGVGYRLNSSALDDDAEPSR